MKTFFEHIKKPNQKFRCYECGDELETLKLDVNLENKLNSSANDLEIQKLKDLVPDNNEIIEFYNQHNGIKLYCNKEISGIQIYPVSELENLNEEWKEGFSYLDDEELYDFQKGGFAFGEISHSGNYFVLYQNKVYYADHDDFDEEPIANSFFEFLEKTIHNPADFLYELGCYTRYSDGKSGKQWIPKEYFIDIK